MQEIKTILIKVKNFYLGLPAKYKTPKATIIIILSTLFFCCLCWTALYSLTPAGQAASTARALTQTAAPTKTDWHPPTSTHWPTNTPKPTRTSTHTPLPTETPPPTPIATAPQNPPP